MNSDFIRNLFVKRRAPPRSGAVRVGALLLEELAAMEPGEIMKISDISGREFALLAIEDLQHITERAGMRLTDRI